MSQDWLSRIICQSALHLEVSQKTIFRFGQSINIALSKNPIQEWELAAWARGLNRGFIKMEGYFFRVGAGKRSPLSFFIRNDQDLYVGLRRESITQAATYISLVMDYGYSRSQTRFESQWMDVAVYDNRSDALIYAENKAHSRTLEKLCARLKGEFEQHIPFYPEDESSRVEDALMKAQHIWRHKPKYFWAVCPLHRYSYRVIYSRSGFTLESIEQIPKAIEWIDSLSPVGF